MEHNVANLMKFVVQDNVYIRDNGNAAVISAVNISALGTRRAVAMVLVVIQQRTNAVEVFVCRIATYNAPIAYRVTQTKSVV